MRCSAAAEKKTNVSTSPLALCRSRTNTMETGFFRSVV